jgi:hypothetical protein
MNIYLLPDNLIQDIERMINAFWWGGGSNTSGIKWLAWDKLACPKDEGGLGFRDFHSFNMAMVAKQGWNFMNNPTTLVARLYKARYFPKNSFFEANIGNNPSFAWRSIWRARQVLFYGCTWQIGDGSKIKIMHEPWLRNSDESCLKAPQSHNVYNLTVHHLMLPNMKKWDVAKINSLFPIEVAKDIVAVPLLEVVKEDRLVWREEKDGKYSVRSGYRKFLKERGSSYVVQDTDGWSGIWRIHAPPKAKHLLWRICKECLPTRSRLINRFVQCPVECPLCFSCNEEEFHLFFNCDSIREAWQVTGLANIIQSRLHLFTNIRELIFDICRNESNLVAGKVAVLLWFAWQNRNNKVWNDTCSQASQIGQQAAQYWFQWATVQGLLHDQQQQNHPVPAATYILIW